MWFLPFEDNFVSLLFWATKALAASLRTFFLEKFHTLATNLMSYPFLKRRRHGGT